MKIPDPIPDEELLLLKEALNTEAPSDLEKNCFNRLKEYLRRVPTTAELRNMKSDTNLLTWVLTEQ